jgi:hypothetical protein
MSAVNRNVVDRKRQSGGLTFPIKLRCVSPAGLITEPGLEAALTQSLGKAFAKVRSALPAAVFYQFF